MKKIINDPANFVRDTMEGIAFAYAGKVALIDGDVRLLRSTYPQKKGKVGIVTAGGSGHLPLFLGYVGQGLVDGCVVGNVFASPSAAKIEQMIRACDFGGGVLCLYGNYGGDRMNFTLACDSVEFDGIVTHQILVKDDIASAPIDQKEKRRGVAGLVYAYKIAGAAAERMYDIERVVEITQSALQNIRTIGVATAPCIIPNIGSPSFVVEDNQIEIGMGIHGEPGINTSTMMTADELANLLLDKLLDDMPVSSGNTVSVMINGLGSTPLEEQFIFYRAVYMRLKSMGIRIHMPHIGEFATSMEMAGLSLTLFQLDDELKSLLDAPACSPFYTNYNK